MCIYEELKKANGNHFQDLFSQLMKEKFGSQFQPTVNHGRIGDMGVDGVLNLNTAFAVYAPIVYDDKKTVNKLNSDFNSFLAQRRYGNWGGIQKFIFVVKSEKNGITATVLNAIMSNNIIFPTEIWTLEDLKLLAINYLPFSEDGRLLQELKNDITNTMEYIIKTDFSAVPFKISLLDDIDFIIEKWKCKRYSFKKKEMEDLKNRILKSLSELCNYLTPSYVHLLHDNILIFNNDSYEAGEQLRDVMSPQTIRIRCEVGVLLDELYTIN